MKTIILDCDGTVYQDLDFDLVYFEYILRNDSRFELKHLHELCELITQGEILRMNTQIQLPEKHAQTMTELTDMLAHLETVKVTLNNDPHLLYLGDLWAVLTLIGKCIGIDEQTAQKAFYHTRSRHLKRLEVNHALNDAIRRCNEKMTVCLLTNSPEDTAHEFIEKLGLTDAFSVILYDCHKPYGLMDAIKAYNPQILDDIETITMIGDHYYNDLFQLTALGAATIWMNPYPKIHRPNQIFELNTLKELTAYLNCLASGN